MSLAHSLDLSESLTFPPLPEAVKQQPDVELLREGLIASRHSAFGVAGAFFAEVYRRDRVNPFVMLEIAKIFQQTFEFDKADQWLCETLRIVDKDVDMVIRVGDAYAVNRDHGKAEEIYLKALRLAPTNQGVWACLIWFYERTGQLTKAKETLARAKKKNIRGPLFSVIRAIVASHHEKPTEIIPMLQAALEKLPPHDSRTNRARYRVAELMAQSGREMESIDALKSTKQLQLANPEVVAFRELSGKMVQQIQSLGEGLLAEGTESWRADIAGAVKRPLVFLIGYPRSGTTLLEQVVEAHSRVKSIEETDVFEQTVRVACRPWTHLENGWRNLCDTPADRLQKSRQTYFELIERIAGPLDPAITLIDKNPSLTARLHWIGRMFPDAKLLFMVRDPRDICISAYQRDLSNTAFNVNWLDWDDTVRHCGFMLRNWLRLRDRLPNPWLEVRYEDLVADLPTVGRRVMEFLELDWQAQQEDFVSHARAKTVFSPSAYQVRQKLNQNARGKWRKFNLDYSAGGEPFAEVLTEFGYEPE